MTYGVISSDRDALIKLAWYIEEGMPGAEYCETEGGGAQESRKEYRLIYRHSIVTQGPDETSLALVLDADATTQWASLKPALTAKVDADRTPLERIIATLPDASDFTPYVWPNDP
jgi:hypothetical protein